MKVIMFHNPSCSKCMSAMNQLQESQCDIEVISYLDQPPPPAELKKIIDMLGIRPEELVRKKEPVYQQQFEGKILSDDEWIEAMTRFPVLIERPILIRGNQAIIGREEDKVREFIIE